MFKEEQKEEEKRSYESKCYSSSNSSRLNYRFIPNIRINCMLCKFQWKYNELFKIFIYLQYDLFDLFLQDVH